MRARKILKLSVCIVPVTSMPLPKGRLVTIKIVVLAEQAKKSDKKKVVWWGAVLDRFRDLSVVAVRDVRHSVGLIQQCVEVVRQVQLPAVREFRPHFSSKRVQNTHILFVDHKIEKFDDRQAFVYAAQAHALREGREVAQTRRPPLTPLPPPLSRRRLPLPPPLRRVTAPRSPLPPPSSPPPPPPPPSPPLPPAISARVFADSPALWGVRRACVWSVQRRE